MNNLENSLTKFPFLFTSMIHAWLHEDMQQVKLGGRGILLIIITPLFHYHHSIFCLIYNLWTFLFQRYSIALCFISIVIHIGMIQNYEKGLSYTQWCFLMHIDSIYFPGIIWVNYYPNNKRTNNEMNVINTRTNILYIHGCHTRTNHKKNVSGYSCKSHLGKHSLSSLKGNIQMPKFLEKIHA